MKKFVCAVLLAFGVGAGVLYAGETGTSQLQTPQGSGSGTAFGDYVSDAAALNTAYHFFVEVPPGVGQLNIDIYDPDCGIGSPNEATAGRDRDRTNAITSARYSIFNPSGATRTPLFTTGNDTAPVNSDAAWTPLFTSTGDTVRDNFGTAAYTNNDGLASWSTNWLETNDDNSATGGMMQITGGELRIQDDNNANVSTITREANLTGWTTATLTFNLRTANVEAGDQMRVQVSNNGGGSWTTLETFTGAIATGSSRTYDITTSIASNTRIRFLEVTGYSGSDSFFVDNVQIKDSAIQNGHWEVRVDMSNTVTTAEGINAFGIRANDGDSSSGGTELNIYADSFVALGANPPASGVTTRNYTFFPYFTSGCSCSHNDYDYDSNRGDVGSAKYTSPSAAFSQTIAAASLSGDDVWNRDSITGFTTDSHSFDYGIWQLDEVIKSYLVAGAPNGNYTVVYDTSYAAAANPPTTNPATNTFRIYLGTDENLTAPAKPYLEQQLTQRVGPLTVGGSVARYTVTVSVVNPTPHAITFSAARLVTAYIPTAPAGSTTTYGGNPQMSQGAIGSAPAIGGTGNITWNPGTVAAGATAIFSYDVHATTTTPGLRLPITATPASTNGTRATWLDETANASQARAIFTFGPLCELAVTEGLATEVLLSKVDVSVRGGATLVAWTTASEAGTVGFNVYRLDRGTNAAVKVNRSMLPANPGKGQGSHYRFVDPSNSDPAPSYYLEELTARGKALRYGPFTQGANASTEPLPSKPFDGVARTSKGKSAVKVAGKKSKPSAVMVGVRKTGITRVAAADIAAALNASSGSIEAAVKTGRLSLTSRGAQVAWTAAADNSAILFFGEAPDSQYSTERVYRIEVDKGTTMSVTDVASAPAHATAFSGTADAEVDSFPAAVLPLDPESDYWFWDFILSGDPDYGRKSFPIDVPSVAATDNATLQVRLQGAIADIPHHARVAVNGVPVGEMTWSSLDGKSADLAIPAAVLHSGANSIDVEGVLESSAPWDVFYIDGFTVRYTRAAQAVNGALEMNVSSAGPVTASGFGSGVMAFDVTTRTRPSLLRGGSAANGDVSLVTPAAARTLYFADASAVAGPSSLRAADAVTLNDKKNGADYLVIAPAAVRPAADALAQLRARDGLTTYVADLEQVYDEYSGGNVTPYAIRDFLASTRQWNRAPKYVVLAGTGSYDYRGVFTDPGLVPPLMTKTSNGIFAADSRFTDFNGDGLPDLAIGRIPVSTNDELDAYVRKLDSSARAAAAGSMVFSADAQDRGADFRRSSGLAEAAVAGRPAAKVYMDDLGGEGARNALFAAWKDGSPLVSWVGHGGVDRLSAYGVITPDDAAALTSSNGQLPVLVAMTCTINRFELGEFEALGAALARVPNSGALAVWSASGLSLHGDAASLEQTFYRLAARTPGARVGDLIVQSLAANPSIGETGSVYLLLGDPAIRLSLPVETAPIDNRPPKGRE
jgi:hypothetical protein